MQTVADRFFEAFDALLAMGETKIQTFCREEIPTAWLTFIVEHYGVSPRWLLIGRGQMFTK